MSSQESCELSSRHCVPCEGGVSALSSEEATRLLKEIQGWSLVQEGKVIERKWTVKNFVAGMAFLNQVADVAEEEQHHPDVHLTGYRNVTIQLTTHAIKGLSENDFILAAKINGLNVSLKT